MKITIIVAGAIGGVIGAYLAKAREDITFVDVVDQHVEVIRRDGLKIELKDESFKVNVKAFTLKEFIELDIKLDTVFLCVKAQNTNEALSSVSHMLTGNSVIVSMQNGLCEPEISKIIGANRTIGCFVNLFADYKAPGVINYGGVGSLYIGELDGSYSNRIMDIHKSLSHWGNVKITDNIMGYVWGKLSYLIVLIATALTDEKIADLLEDERWRELFLDISSEILEVAHKSGILPMGFDNWEPSLIYPTNNRDYDEISKELELLVARLRSYTKVKSGIWRDLAIRKRKTEVKTQYYPVLELSEFYNVKMPKTRALINMITEIEEGRRKMDIDNLEELYKYN